METEEQELLIEPAASQSADQSAWLDAKRLDWLEKNPTVSILGPYPPDDLLWEITDATLSRSGIFANTLREAIDAAIAAAPKEPKP